MQCPDCDAKDLVTIAGKTFCANCGTPASDAGQSISSSVNTTDTTNAAATDSEVNAQQTPIAAQSPQQVTAQPVTNLDTNTNSSISEPPAAPGQTTNPVLQSPQQQQADQVTSFARFHSPSSAVESVSTPTSPEVPVVPVVDSLPVVPAPVGPPPPDDTTAAQAREAIANIQMSQPSSVPAPVTADLPVDVASAPVPQPTPQAPVMPVEEHVASSYTPKDANIGSEISSLDSRDEGVFTDEQLSELSNASSEVVSSQPNSYAPVKPMQDIRPGGSTQVVIQPTANASTNAFSAPTPQPTQTISSNSIDSMSQAAPSAMPVAGSMIKPTNINTDGIDATAARAATSAASEANTLLAQTQAPTLATQPQPANAPPKKQKKVASKIASVSLSMAGIILLGVYVWQINYPNLALKVAGSKAGISASLPSYMPSGWKVSGDIQANPGSIGYNLQSEDGSKKISVSEDRTDWDSQALAENYLQTKADNYTALQAQGLTIYLYDNQASWVNHGTWYRIEGDNHGLSQDQIIKMATSL